MKRSGTSGSSSLPNLALIAISQPEAALKNKSLSPSLIISTTRGESLLLSVIHHKKVCVSINAIIARMPAELTLEVEHQNRPQLQPSL